MWKNFRGYGSNCGRASERVVSATDGVMSDTITPSEDFKMAGSGLEERRLR